MHIPTLAAAAVTLLCIAPATALPLQIEPEQPLPPDVNICDDNGSREVCAIGSANEEVSNYSKDTFVTHRSETAAKGVVPGDGDWAWRKDCPPWVPTSRLCRIRRGRELPLDVATTATSAVSASTDDTAAADSEDPGQPWWKDYDEWNGPMCGPDGWTPCFDGVDGMEVDAVEGHVSVGEGARQGA